MPFPRILFPAAVLLILSSVPVTAAAPPARPLSNHEAQIKVPVPPSGSFNTWSGALHMDLPLMERPGRGLPVRLGLIYDSGWSAVDFPTGRGWRLSADMYYAWDKDGEVVVVWESGQADRFVQQDGAFLPPLDVAVRFAEQSPGQFVLRTPEGTEYLFESPVHKRVTRIREPNGNAVTFEYDGEQRLASAVHSSSGRRVDLSWTGGRVTSLRDELGRTVTLSYDPAGHLTAVSDWTGRTHRFTYGAGHLLAGITDPLGRTTAVTYAAGAVTGWTAAGLQKTVLYDRLNRVTELAEPAPAGVLRTRFTYDDLGRVTRVERVPKEGTPLVRTFRWSPRSLLLSLTDEGGRTTKFTYDERNRVTAIADPGGGTQFFEYENVYNKVVRWTDRGDRVTASEHDSRGNLVKQVDPAGGVRTWEIDAAGGVVRSTDPAGAVTAWERDTAGNPVVVTDPLGGQERFAWDADGRMVSQTDATGRTTILRRDALGRLVETVDPAGATTRFEHDAAGRVTRIQGPAGNAVQYAWDEADRLIRVTNALGGQTRYTYDAAGNLAGVTDAAGHSTTFRSDAFGRRVSEIDPLGKETVLAYDPMGNLQTRSGPAGLVRYTWDALDRLTAADLPGTARDATFTYDAAGNRVSARNAAATLRTTWDALGRPTRVTWVLPGFSRTFSYAYDAAGRRTRRTDPDGGAVEYAWDAAGRLTSLTDPAGRRTSFTYDAAGRALRRALPNGAEILWEHDAAGRVSRLEHRLPGGVLSSRDSGYDSSGNLSQRSDGTGTTAYEYDPLDRLVRVTGPGGSVEAFGFDAVGNRTSRTAGGAEERSIFDAADRLLRSGFTTYRWDEAGRLASRTTTSGETRFEWDEEGRLASLTLPGNRRETFLYVADGTLLGRTSPAGVTTYTLWDDGNPVYETDASGNRIARHLAGPGLDQWISTELRGAWYAFHPDELGSILALSDTSGQVAASYTYDVFGAVRGEQGTVSSPFRFTGRDFLPEAGLAYHRARFYDPAAGRFISPDPFRGTLEDPRTLHRYLYANASPATWVDPTGLFGWPSVIVRGIVNFLSGGSSLNSSEQYYFNQRDYGPRTPPSGGTSWVNYNQPSSSQSRTNPASTSTGSYNYSVSTSGSTYTQNGNTTTYACSYSGRCQAVGGNGGCLSCGYGSGGGYPSSGSYGGGGGGGGGAESKPLDVVPSYFLRDRIETAPATPVEEIETPRPLPARAAGLRAPRAVHAALRVSPGDPPRTPLIDLEKKAPRHPAASAAPPSLVRIEDLLPTRGPAGTSPVLLTPPNPLGGTTNAVDARAVDFVDRAANAVRGTVFATRTLERAYEHDYAVCNRFHAYSLQSASPVPLALGGPAPAWFWLLTTTRDRLVEEAFVFAVFVDEDTRTFTLDSRWLADLYPRPENPEWEYLFNLQIWASSSRDAESLLRQVVGRLAAMDGWSVRFNNTAAPSGPRVIVRSSDLEPAGIRLRVWSWLAAPAAVRFHGTFRRPQDRLTNLDFSFDPVLVPGLNTIVLPVGSILDAVVDVEAEGFLDRVYVGAGFWFGFDEAGGSRIQVSEPPCPPVSGLTGRDYPLLGCARMTGSVRPEGYAGLGRTLNPNGRPVDLARYRALTFRAQGDGKSYRVAVETESVGSLDTGDFHQAVFTAAPEWRQIVIPFLALRQQGWDPAKVIPFSPADVKAAVWLAVGHPLPAVDLSLDGVAFTNSTVIEETRGPADTDAAGPYPVETRVTDDVGIISVSLHYSTDGGRSFKTLPLTAAGGDLWKASLPGQRLETEVRWYLEARDGDGNVARDPFDAPYALRRFQVSRRPSLLVDEFSNTDPDNDLGADSGVFRSAGKGSIQWGFGDGTLRLDWDVSAPGSFAGYTTALGPVDVTRYHALTFQIRGAAGGERLKVGLRDATGTEGKVLVSQHLPAGIGKSWQRVVVPLQAFTTLRDPARAHAVVFVLESGAGAGKGTVWVDLLRFETLPALPSLSVDNFNLPTLENGLGGPVFTSTSGATLAAAHDSRNRVGSTGAGFRLAYGGVVPGRWAVAVWDLRGLNASGLGSLTLQVKGARGGERPNLYLVSGTGAGEKVAFVDVERYKPLKTGWQKVTVPLSAFPGINLRNLTQLRLAFEFETMAGTVYVDDVRLEP